MKRMIHIRLVLFLLIFFLISCSAMGANDAVAQRELALKYIECTDMPRNYEKAFKLLSKSAKQGDAIAQTELGLLYFNGYGVPQNYRKSFKWQMESAKQGYALAQIRLGFMYSLGEGAPQQSDVKAYAFFHLAAAQNDASAVEELPKLKQQMTPDQIAEGQRQAEILFAEIKKNAQKAQRSK